VTKRLTLLLATALLVFGLTACGCSSKDSGNNGSAVVGGETAGTQSDSASPNTGTSNGESGSGTGSSTNGENNSGTSGSANSGSGSGTGGSMNDGSGTSGSGSSGADSGNSLLDDAQDAVDQGINNARNALDGTTGTTRNRAGGVSFQKMLENGRVHDRDGDLTDGENSVSSKR